MIAGVCGGLAEYFNVDPVIIRIIAFILLLPGGLPGFIDACLCRDSLWPSPAMQFVFCDYEFPRLPMVVDAIGLLQRCPAGECR